MRFPVVICVLTLGSVACDLQPPPKKRAAPTDTVATPPTPPTDPGTMPPTPPPALPVDAGVAPPVADAPVAIDAAVPEVATDCLAIGGHIADVLIKEATDPAQKAALEQDKTKIVRRSAEGCTRDGWSAASKACFLKAATVDAMQICGKDLKAPE